MTIAACPPATLPPHGVVVFVPATFKTAYPEFATIADTALVANFGLAQLQLNNACESFVSDASIRETLLNLLVAHITTLRNGANGQPAPGMVGRIGYAIEGSVAATAEMGPQVYGQAYYSQTQWGAMYWTATARFRQMRFVAAPQPCWNLGPGFDSSW
jgi:hypothetical protein